MNMIVSHIAMILLSLIVMSGLSGGTSDFPGGQDVELLTCIDGEAGSTCEDGPDDIDHDDDEPPVSLCAVSSDINWASNSGWYDAELRAFGTGMVLPPPEWMA